jgi:2-methylcitrate dehydratase
MTEMEGSDTVAGRLARYSREVSYRHFSEEVVHEAKRHLIDTLACALGGWKSLPAKIARDAAAKVRLRSGATLLGTGQKTTADLAAFANGTAVRFLDYNDTYLSKEPAHPSDNIAAALAAAEIADRGGRGLIEAMVLGYEIQCRLCDAASLRPKGWDHVTYGGFSTALVAAKLWRLTESKTFHAVGLAGTPNNALRQTRVGQLSMWKASAFANAARNGLFAAELAQLGMTGPAPIFEGEKGFMKTVSGPFSLPPLDPKGPFKILETYIKYYPVEYHAQSAVQAALALHGQIPVKHAIESVTVRTSDVSYEIIGRDPEKWHPKTRETADHSLPYCVAVALMDGVVGLRQFDARRIADPKLHALIQETIIISDPDLSAAYPDVLANIVEVKTAEKVYTERVDHPKGHPKNPMTDAEVEEKFRRMAAPFIPNDRVEKILEQLWNLEKVRSVTELLSLFKIRGTP